MKHSLLVLTMLGLVGCATNFPSDRSKMSPEQIKADAADKNAAVACTVFRNAAGTASTMSANLDKLAVYSGEITVKPGSDCETVIRAEGKPAAAPKPAASAASGST